MLSKYVNNFLHQGASLIQPFIYYAVLFIITLVVVININNIFRGYLFQVVKRVQVQILLKFVYF